MMEKSKLSNDKSSPFLKHALYSGCGKKDIALKLDGFMSCFILCLPLYFVMLFDDTFYYADAFCLCDVLFWAKGNRKGVSQIIVE